MEMFNKFGLQSKIISVAVIVSLLSIAAVSFMGYFSYQGQYKKAADSFAKELQIDTNSLLESKTNIALTNALSISSDQALLAAVASGDKKTTNQILGKVNETYK